MMMASAHWRLHQAQFPNIAFHDVWWYGTSTLNQRIEAWWRHMSRSQTLAWKVLLNLPSPYVVFLYIKLNLKNNRNILINWPVLDYTQS